MQGPMTCKDTLLFEQGAWKVASAYDNTDGNTWCSAHTTNRRGQVLSLIAYGFGAIRLFVIDPTWDLSKRPVHYRIDIDYDQWDVTGLADGIAVSMPLDEGDKSKTFFVQLMTASAVATYNEDGIRLATFSLDGSKAAIDALFDCWIKILDDKQETGGRDPFVRTADPF